MSRRYAAEAASSRLSTQCAQFYRDAKIGKIYEGTSHIQLETIAKNIYRDRQ